MPEFHYSKNLRPFVLKRHRIHILLLFLIVFTVIFFASSLSSTKINQNQYLIHRMISYFDFNGDAFKVKWSHGVNSKEALINALNSDSNFLEADILKIDPLHTEPIMAHPPQTSSDLTFTQWLHEVKSSQKGLKLDFKTWNSVEPCLIKISSIRTEIKTPVVLNADVFQGVNAPVAKIDPHLFINKSLELYPKGVLSLGWTTTNNQLGQYSWADVYEAFQILKSKNLVDSKDVEVTFAVRLLWSVNSINRLMWLQKMTGCSLTLWSHFTDKIYSLDPLLLFRKYFNKASVYYDLQLEESRFFEENALDAKVLEERLSVSNDQIVKEFIKKQKLVELSMWNHKNGVFYKSDFGVLMLESGASLRSKRECRVNDTNGIYEFSGSFEMFSIKNSLNSLKSSSSILKDLDNNIDAEDKQTDNYVKISMRTSYNSVSPDGPYANSPGSVNFYIFANGLIRVYIGDLMQQEANLQEATRIKFTVTDVGDSADIHVDLNSWDRDFNKLSLQLLIPAFKYVEGQEFYAGLTIFGDGYAVGVDSLRLLDDIEDPQDRDNNQE